MDEKKVREAIEDIKKLSEWLREEGSIRGAEHCDTSIEALEKQLPKKVDNRTKYRGLNGELICFKGFCPSCGWTMDSYRNKSCHHCTQMLDWSE